MTRNDAIQLAMKEPFTESWFELIMKTDYASFIDMIYDDFEQQICDNCQHDGYGCSVQDSILRADPDATFTTFGCNSFKSCK